MSSQRDHSDDHFHYALKSNASWASYQAHSSPQYFQKFTAGQAPTILWLGCSDSRVPETTLLGLQPGEVFVHRNIANIITTSDLNVLAVIEYAVVHLKVAHIVLCGHTSCGGAAAALQNSRIGGVLDAWLTPLKVVRRENQAEIDAIKEESEKAVRLAELNVEEGVKNLMANAVVEEAIRERGLKVHGTIYDLGCGLLRELGVGTDQPVLHGAVSNKLRGQLVHDVRKEEVVEEKKVVTGSHGTLVFKDDGASMEIK